MTYDYNIIEEMLDDGCTGFYIEGNDIDKEEWDFIRTYYCNEKPVRDILGDDDELRLEVLMMRLVLHNM